MAELVFIPDRSGSMSGLETEVLSRISACLLRNIPVFKSKDAHGS